MKYIAIVLLLITAASVEQGNAMRIINSNSKLTGEDSAAAEADLDALMNKYDDKEESDKKSKDKKSAQGNKPVDPN